MDLPSFLRSYPPFDELDDERLAEVVRHTHIEFYPAGTLILQQTGEPAKYLYVIRTGALELLDGTQVLDHLLEGEVFGHFSLFSGLGPTFSIRVLEDSLCYLIDEEVAQGVMSTRRGLAFLSATLRRREGRALDGIDAHATDPLRTSVRSLLRRPPVTASVSVTVREAAGLMTRERVSCLLVEGSRGWGIVTDRDLRSKVLAPGLSSDTPLSEIMSFPLLTIEASAMVPEALAFMFEHGIHHVPVVEDRGDPFGVVTDTDLMGLEQWTPFSLKSAIERAATSEEMIEAAGSLAQTVGALVEANADPLEVGHIVAVEVDTITRRALELGIREFGDPPRPWAWVALGSEARQEQGLLTDQDNALMVETKGSPMGVVDPYFERLATFVNERLADAGIPRCRAGVIASNREWRDSLLNWQFRFRVWMSDPGRIGGAFSGIAFDYRPVAGPLDVRPALDDVIREAPNNPQFIRHLARLAIHSGPPTGFLKDTVVEARGTPTVTLDVKHGGITLITNLARVYALRAGITENRTLRRLHEVVAAGGIPDVTQQGLEEAFRLLWQIRLEHQARQVRDGTPPDDLVDPRSLGPLARQGLKEAFRMIDRAQGTLAAELGLRR